MVPFVLELLLERVGIAWLRVGSRLPIPSGEEACQKRRLVIVIGQTVADVQRVACTGHRHEEKTQPFVDGVAYRGQGQVLRIGDET